MPPSYVTTGDLVAFIDADLREFDAQFAVGLLGPLLTNRQTHFRQGVLQPASPERPDSAPAGQAFEDAVPPLPQRRQAYGRRQAEATGDRQTGRERTVQVRGHHRIDVRAFAAPSEVVRLCPSSLGQRWIGLAGEPGLDVPRRLSVPHDHQLRDVRASHAAALLVRERWDGV